MLRFIFWAAQQVNTGCIPPLDIFQLDQWIIGCNPLGKDGQNGAKGADGKDGVDANETCKLCHNPDVVDAVAVQFELSKHSYGEAAFEEAGNTTCAPCHESTAFRYVCENTSLQHSHRDPMEHGAMIIKVYPRLHMEISDVLPATAAFIQHMKEQTSLP